MPVPTHATTASHDLTQFDKDIRDVHLLYDYEAKDANGNPEKWRYEMWFFSSNRIVYAIHGGPMAGRLNYQTASYQCIRPGELWQCNWLEETGTICSLVYDIPKKKITTLLGFSQGHWEYAEEAHGDKRKAADLERWRGLAGIGKQTDRFMLNEQANILEIFKGKGDFVPIGDFMSEQQAQIQISNVEMDFPNLHLRHWMREAGKVITIKGVALGGTIKAPHRQSFPRNIPLRSNIRALSAFSPFCFSTCRCCKTASMMASSSDRDKDNNDSEPKPENPFIKFRQFADSQISSLLQGIIGLPSAFTKRPNNARWADFDEEMRRRDELQATQKELRDSEARKAQQQTQDDWPHWLNSNKATGEEMDDKLARDIPLYSPVSKSLFAHLPVAKADRWGGSAEWRHIPEDKVLQFLPNRDYRHNPSPIAGLQSSVYSDLNENGILRSQYSLLPYLLFSPYSPVRLGMDARSEEEADKYCDAFQDLILISRGSTLDMPRRTCSNNGYSSPIEREVGPDRSWIYHLWASGILQEKGSTSRPDISRFHNTLKDSWHGRYLFEKAPSEDAQTEQELYERFLTRASSPMGVAEILESLFADAEGWITKQMASLDPNELKRELKEFTDFLEQTTGDEAEDKKRANAAKTLESIFEQTVGFSGNKDDGKPEQKRKVETFSETKVGKELEDLKRKAAADPKAVFVSTTTEHTTHEDGTVETEVRVWKRFADGRETTTTTTHVEEPACRDDDDEDAFHEQTGFPKPPEQKKEDKQSEKKGWFWN